MSSKHAPEAVHCFVNASGEVVAMSVACPAVVASGETIVRYTLALPADVWEIVTKLAAIADGLANGNSGAEEIATRLAEKARAAISKATGEA